MVQGFKRLRRLAPAALACALLPQPVAAAQSATAPAQREGEWLTEEAAEGCTVATHYSDGTSLVLTYDGYDGDGFIFLGNPRWRSIVPGRQYQLTMEMVPFGLRSLAARGTPVEGLGGFSIPFTGVELISEFMEADTLVIEHGRNVVGRYALSGSHDAALELARCNRRMRERVKADPFGG